MLVWLRPYQHANTGGKSTTVGTSVSTTVSTSNYQWYVLVTAGTSTTQSTTVGTSVSTTKSCHSVGGNIPSVRNEGENRFISDLIEQNMGSNPYAWLGASDAVQETNWLWSDGTVFDYVNWHRGQPDNINSREHCLATNYGAKTNWADFQCETGLVYVCAKPVAQIRPTPVPKDVSLTLEGFICKCTPDPKAGPHNPDPKA
ncbi:hypothetical protein WMY93_031998 [Mugilogobius chulae]|uniref:C-type lectin domain-containing protein n=1 Tax=Mugilogobius chulae TaxID=88201 RepID=A0AAW0MCR8_9GOBI